MGTNYYLRTEICPHCDREKERIHVGKSSGGWPFLFRGYRKWPPDGLPHPIITAREWREFLTAAEARGGALYDEYGQRQELTEFWAHIERKRAETEGPSLSPQYQHGEREYEWFDAEGYRFCDNEFS